VRRAGRPPGRRRRGDAGGEPNRSVYDAECDNDLPGRLVRGEGDDPAGGDPEADAVYDNLGQVFDYYAGTFGRDSYDDSGAELIASINFCENPARRRATPTGTEPR
jgi:Zn-dependent metalloprotease